MEGLPIKKTKKAKRVRELRENPSRTITGNVRTEGLGGCSGNRGRGAKQFEVPRVPVRMPKSSAQRGKEFRERKGKLAASPVEKVTKKRKNSANSSSATAKSPSEYMREY
ncbi:hypothetical protein TNCV_5064701 [Trichonephila clavipes]|nr:hypothetical protein TNCV_5064701 [Trichonephila clavipes]